NNNFNLMTLLFMFLFGLIRTYHQKYINQVIDYFWPTYSISIYEIDKNCSMYGRRNRYYEYLSFFINQNQSLLKTKKMKIEKSTYIENKYLEIKQQKILDDYPDILPEYESKMYYNHNGISVTILNTSIHDSKKNKTNSKY